MDTERLLKGVRAEMAKGEYVPLELLQTEITSQQAAELLNVSHSYLTHLLNEKKIAFRQIGEDRLVRLEDIVAYKRHEDEARLRVLSNLVAQAQELDMGY